MGKPSDSKKIKSSKSLGQKPSKKTTSSKSKPKKVEPAFEPTVSCIPEVQEVVATPVVDPTTFIPPSSSRRTAVDRDSLQQMATHLLRMIEQQWQLSQENRARNIKLQVWKDLHSEAKKFSTVAVKSARKKTRTNTTPNSGFRKPVNVSEHLAKFLKLDPNSQISRLDVTQRICAYIKENNLQNPSDKRIILPDKDLGNLLQYNCNEGNLTYFALQKLLQPHFIKTEVVTS